MKKKIKINKDELNLTISALDASSIEFRKLKKVFNDVSDTFDDGDNQVGLELIQDDVANGIGALENFVLTVFTQFSNVLTTKLKKNITDNISTMQELFTNLTEETVKGNFTEVGDILRFDFSEFIEELASVFVNISKELKELKI